MNDKKIIFFDLLPFILVCLFLPAVISGNFTTSVKNGLSFYAGVTLPSAFLVFFVTAYIARLNVTKFLASKTSPLFYKAFHANSYGGLAFIIGLVSGYPAGSKIVADFCCANLIENRDAKRICCLVSCPPISFTVFTLGRIMLGNTILGVKIYLVCMFSSLVSAFLFCRSKNKPTQIPQQYESSAGAIYDSAFSACSTALTVGALIVVFYVLCDVLACYGLLCPIERAFYAIFGDIEIAKGLTQGIFESTKGLKILSSAKNKNLGMATCCFLVGFSGISNIAQAVIFLKKAKIKTARFILSKIVCAVLSFSIGYSVSFV